ncbi:MAG: hypothetical protein RL660_1626 [Bacteroidota bacterium]|jgi:hypothetical protein
MKSAIVAVCLIVTVLLAGLLSACQSDRQDKPQSPAEYINSLDKQNTDLRNGDVIFQTSQSEQCEAIQIATKSKYSHCGLVFHKPDDTTNWYVLEAVQPVQWTPLDEFIARGENEHYVVKRLRADPMYSEEMLLQLRANALQYLGKDYDLAFEWSDDRIYCSELVWKAYQKTFGKEIGTLQKLKAFDLTHEKVVKILKERYGSEVPLEETVISPQAIFENPNMRTVVSM